jgi:hypothetical protein
MTVWTVVIVMVGIIWALGARMFESAQEQNSPWDFEYATPEPAIPEDALTVAEMLATRDNATAQEVELGQGEWISGEGFEPGRYTVTAAVEGQGSQIRVDPGEYDPGPYPQSYSINPTPYETTEDSAVLTLPRGAVLSVQSANAIKLTPASTADFAGMLGVGDWDAGIDFEPGTYRLAPVRDFGVSFVLLAPPAEGEEVWLREAIIDYLEPSGEAGPTSVDLEIPAGATLYLADPATLTRQAA